MLFILQIFFSPILTANAITHWKTVLNIKTSSQIAIFVSRLSRTKFRRTSGHQALYFTSTDVLNTRALPISSTYHFKSSDESDLGRFYQSDTQTHPPWKTLNYEFQARVTSQCLPRASQSAKRGCSCGERKLSLKIYITNIHSLQAFFAVHIIKETMGLVYKSIEYMVEGDY